MTKRAEHNWFAVYTAPKAEKRVFERLSQIGIEAYLPLQKVVRQWSDRKKQIEVPLINSYVFVRIASSEHMKVLTVFGVSRFLYYLGKPAVIRNVEIEILKEFLNKTNGYRIWFEKDQQVEIIEGPLIGKTGKIERIAKDKLRLRIEQLDITLYAQLDKSSVRVIGQTKSKKEFEKH